MSTTKIINSKQKGVDINDQPLNYRLLIGIPTTGLVRMEWVQGRYGQIIPCNWAMGEILQFINTQTPIGYSVADARNIIADKAVRGGFEWLLFIDHDTVIPPTFFIWINELMIDKKYPLISGLYFTKSEPAEPLIYRGRGNGYYKDWTLGDQVWVDGLPMGCTLISVELLKQFTKDPKIPYYHIGDQKVKKIFETPQGMYVDPETMSWYASTGTEDLHFCKRVIENKYLEKAGWPELQKKKYPFIIDTKLFCWHIDPNGKRYPANGEEKLFMKKPIVKKKKGKIKK
jgi:hypothetical protein